MAWEFVSPLHLTADHSGRHLDLRYQREGFACGWDIYVDGIRLDRQADLLSAQAAAYDLIGLPSARPPVAPKSAA